MENQVSNAAHSGDLRSAYSRDPGGMAADDEDNGVMGSAVQTSAAEIKRIDALRIPVGCNLADVERWMIFATLQKCGGNKTRAAALLGVSLKTLYNRLNAYRAQGLTMDYEFAVGESDADDPRRAQQEEREEEHDELGGAEALERGREGGRLAENLRESQ